MSDFHVAPAVEKPVRRAHKRHAAYRAAGLLEKLAAGGRGRVKRYGTRHGSSVACRSLACYVVNPRCSANRAVYRPQYNHQAEPHHRPHEPPPERRFKQNVAQRQMGRIAPRDFPGADVGADVVSEEEQTDNTRNGRKPGPALLPGDESFPKTDDATNPEKL